MNIPSVSVAAVALTLCVPVAAQLPPADGPASATGTVLEPTPIAFRDELLGRLSVPRGFRISVFARDLQNVRWMQVLPNGDIYVTRRKQGDVILLRDADRDGKAEPPQVVAQNIHLAHGLAFRDGKLYLVSDKKLFRFDVLPDGRLSPAQLLLDDLPDAGQHPNRTLAFGPDGMLYLTIGSDCNVCTESNPEAATIVKMQPDGSARTVYARGLRNTIGFGWHPLSGAMYGFDHGSDWRGDEQPPEELNRLEQGKDYGWPYCFGERRVDVHTQSDPPNASKPVFCQTTEAPALTYTAHAAPIGMVFYTGTQFPAGYRNDAFVAFRGSWNRSRPSGYKVVRVHFDGAGKPVSFSDFVTGWLQPPPASYTRPGANPPPAERQEAARPAQFGRIAGLAVWHDGSLLIAEDQNGVIYRVSHDGSAAQGDAR